MAEKRPLDRKMQNLVVTLVKAADLAGYEQQKLTLAIGSREGICDNSVGM